MMRTTFSTLLFAVLLIVVPLSSIAAPCAGFIDVEDTSPFCPSVAWIKNRNVTTGCAIPNSYCPADAVSRLGMAAFMQRLGTALLPDVHVTQLVINQPINLDSGAFLCVNAQSIPIAGYTRIARIDAIAQLVTPGTVGAAFEVDPVVSVDGGATWSFTNAVPHRFTEIFGVAAGSVISIDILLQPGTQAKFGLFVARSTTTTTNLFAANCLIRATLNSAT